MHKQASTYITEVTEQRQRLRNAMSDATFYTWYAETLTILEYIPEIAPLKQRFVDVLRSNDSVVDKVKEVRGILLSVVKRINSPLFGTGKATANLPPNIGGVIVAPNMVQTQTLTQSISVDLDTMLRRVDEVEDISDEKRGEAKSLVKDIWDCVMGGARDSAKLLDFATRLGLLGFNVQEILNGLPF